MMLIEQTGVPEGALPVAAMKDHLRLGSGFADDGMQDALVQAYLRAAMATIEGRTGKALMARRFVWTLAEWRDTTGQALPVAPVLGIVSVTLVAAGDDGVPGGGGGAAGATVDPARYRLRRDMHRPRLEPKGVTLPLPPTGGRIEIVLDAGFGPDWEDVPADLRQAVFLLAAQYHEYRHDAGSAAAALPFGVMALIERWRNVRMLGGGGR